MHFIGLMRPQQQMRLKFQSTSNVLLCFDYTPIHITNKINALYTRPAHTYTIDHTQPHFVVETNEQQNQKTEF